jgi:hypothetical protein
LIARGNGLSKVENKLIQSAADLSAHISRNIGSLKDQANHFRLLTQAELGNVNASEQFNKQLTDIERAFDQVVVSAKSGKDISNALIRAQREVEKLEEDYDRLVESGLLPVGSESQRVFLSMIRQAKNAEAGLQGVRLKKLEKQPKKPGKRLRVFLGDCL